MVGQLNFPAPTFIKIDVDGHEKDIVEGIIPILKMGSLESILVEFNSEHKQVNMVKILEKYSFYMDDRFNNHPKHSSIRRKDNKNAARNVVFSRK